MRVLVYLLLTACSNLAPSNMPRSVRVASAEGKAQSWLERTSPHTVARTVPHVSAEATRVEGPLTTDVAIAESVTAGCYLEANVGDEAPLFTVDYDTPPLTLIMDTRDDGTMAEMTLEPETTSHVLAMCLAYGLAGRPLHVERVPKRVVLTLVAHIRWASR
jgi:hypothetical protein